MSYSNPLSSQLDSAQVQVGEMERILSGNAAMSLSNKGLLLNTPGYITYGDPLYYTSDQTVISAAEITCSAGRQKIPLNSLFLGSQASALIPNAWFLKNMMLNLKLTIPEKSNIYLPMGWGASAIESISLIIGSSNVSSINIPFEALWMKTMLSCESSNKRYQIYKAAGYEQRFTTTGSGATVTAAISLDLFFGNVNSGKNARRLFFDTLCLNQPLQVLINFRQNYEFMGITDPVKSKTGLRPVRFDEAYLTFREAYLQNQSLSLSNAQKKDIALAYNIPSSCFPNVYKTSITMAPGETVEIDSLGYLGSDLNAIGIFIRNKRNVGNSIGDQVARPLFFYPFIESIRVSYQSLIYYSLPFWESWVLDQEVDYSGGALFHDVVKRANFTNVDLKKETYPLPEILNDDGTVQIPLPLIKFNDKNPCLTENDLQNSFRINSNTLKVAIKRDLLDPLANDADYGNEFDVMIIGFYNCSLSMVGGASYLVF